MWVHFILRIYEILPLTTRKILLRGAFIPQSNRQTSVIGEHLLTFSTYTCKKRVVYELCGTSALHFDVYCTARYQVDR